MAEYKGGQRESLISQKYEKQRVVMQETFEKQKEKIKRENEVNLNINKFISQHKDVEGDLKRDTVGLVHLNDFMKIREGIEAANEQERQRKRQLEEERKTRKKSDRAAAAKVRLSFVDDEDANPEGPLEAEDQGAKRGKLSKNPDVDTAFLPDRERETLERLERERLKREWFELQEGIKGEPITIVYSYYDGNNHRRVTECLKGDTIFKFLEKCRQQCAELKGTPIDNIMYIKEDVILPHSYTFYDFIINKIRGKTGPLFWFDVRDDVRLVNDINVETIESHAGKVVLKSWYEKHRHIYPASRWEVFDPNKHVPTAKK